VNPDLSTTDHDACLEILERGLVLIRLAAQAGDVERAEAIADALHNAPRLLREGHKWGWTVAGFRELFLNGLVARYPDLADLGRPLDELD
jgi:hypothetical protein